MVSKLYFLIKYFMAGEKTDRNPYLSWGEGELGRRKKDLETELARKKSGPNAAKVAADISLIDAAIRAKVTGTDPLAMEPSPAASPHERRIVRPGGIVGGSRPRVEVPQIPPVAPAITPPAKGRGSVESAGPLLELELAAREDSSYLSQ